MRGETGSSNDGFVVGAEEESGSKKAPALFLLSGRIERKRPGRGKCKRADQEKFVMVVRLYRAETEKRADQAKDRFLSILTGHISQRKEESAIWQVQPPKIFIHKNNIILIYRLSIIFLCLSINI
jgi:hypothetical protein